MAYIGNEPSVNFTSFAKQDLTGVTGSPTAKREFTLTHAVANANEIEVFVNNVRQEPTESYTVNGTGLTMTGDVETTDDFYIIYLGKAIQTTVPPDGSVSTAKIADDAVNLTSKVTGVLPVANGGSGQSTNTEVFRYGLTSNQSIQNGGGFHLAQMNNAVISNSNYNTTTYKYTVPSGHGGVYLFSLQGNWLTTGDYNNFGIALYKNGSKIAQHYIRQEHYENQNIVTIESVSAGDYFQMYATQESGSSVDFRAEAVACWFSGTRIGA